MTTSPDNRIRDPYTDGRINVVQCIADGNTSTAAIAQELGISPQTVKNTLADIARALGIQATGQETKTYILLNFLQKGKVFIPQEEVIDNPQPLFPDQ